MMLVDDVGTTEWRLAAIVLMDCGERSTPPTWAQAVRLRSSRDVRCSDGLPDRRECDSGRNRLITEGRTNGRFATSHALDLPFPFRPVSAARRMSSYQHLSPEADRRKTTLCGHSN